MTQSQMQGTPRLKDLSWTGGTRSTCPIKLVRVQSAKELGGCAGVAQESGSQLLADLVTAGRSFPDIQGELGQLERATDWAEAQTSGRIMPHPVRSVPTTTKRSVSPTMCKLHMPVQVSDAHQPKNCIAPGNMMAYTVKTAATVRPDVPVSWFNS